MTLTLEVIEPFTVREHGEVRACHIGQRMVLSEEKAKRVMERVGHKVRIVEPDPMDPVIGTTVSRSMEFMYEDGTRVIGVGPWIVTDLVLVDHESGFLPGRWLLLVHGADWRWSHESKTSVFRCPNCKGSRCWWS